MDHATKSTLCRLAMGLAGVFGALLVLEFFPRLQQPFEPVNILLSQAVEYFLARMDMPVMRIGTVLMHPDGFGYRIDYVCSGFRPAAPIAVAILVVRSTWTQRVVGILFALACIEALNVGRLVHLYWLGVHQPDAFFVAHRVIWNVVAVGVVLAYLGALLYLSRGRTRAEDRIPSPHPGDR